MPSTVSIKACKRIALYDVKWHLIARLGSENAIQRSCFENRLMNKNFLVNKFLYVSLLPSQCQGHNSTDVHIWPIHMHVQFELFTDGLDVLETFLEVGTCAADPDLDFVFDEGWGELSEGTNDTLESRRDLTRH